MVDNLTPAERSERMSRIRSADTKPEIALRRALHRLGFRFRLHDHRLPGKPDLILQKYGTVIFVHGCFWHRHQGCKVATTPKSNTEFWINKFSLNVARDVTVHKQLHVAGWRVVIAWECELNSASKALAKATETSGQIRKNALEGGRSREG
jgi:DNA mismatch endonuclease, patch repair protein